VRRRRAATRAAAPAPLPDTTPSPPEPERPVRRRRAATRAPAAPAPLPDTVSDVTTDSPGALPTQGDVPTATVEPAAAAPVRRRRASRAAAAPPPVEPPAAEAPAVEPPAAEARTVDEAPATSPAADDVAPQRAVRRRRTSTKAAAPTVAPDGEEPALNEEPTVAPTEDPAGALAVADPAAAPDLGAKPARRARRPVAPPAVLFVPPEVPQSPVFAAPPAAEEVRPARRRRGRAAADDAGPAPATAEVLAPSADTTPFVEAPPAGNEPRLLDDPDEVLADAEADTVDAPDADAAETDRGDEDSADGGDRRRRRRGRRGRGRGRTDVEDGASPDGGPGTDGGTSAQEAGAAPGDQRADLVAADDASAAEDTADADSGPSDSDEDGDDTGDGSTRRRRRRRRRGGAEAEEPAPDDPPNTVVRVREPRSRVRPSKEGREQRDDDDGVRGITGSTRMAAKRARRQDGRDSGRRRPAIVSEAEFLARRESVDRVMVVRQSGDRTQIAVLEDGVLVEHYVTKASATSYAGNVYLGRVQNVLPSMEAAFIDIGKGRNAVLYAGEVNYDASGLEGKPRKIEAALKSGQSVLVQVTKDPMGHKGARLTSQISLPGRYLVYVPEGSMTGISRKLPDTERKRLKDILKAVLPEDAGVIIRTAAEGASEEEIRRDVERLEAQWQEIRTQAEKAGSSTSTTLLYGEPDLATRVVRDVFNEDFGQLVVAGDEAWSTISSYVEYVAPDLEPRLSRFTGEGDVFSAYRIDEQLIKALDRKVWLPSGGSLVIDRTEAMVVIDVNTGKFTGQGGNLEETVTRNNLEAAEEIVRQLRLRDLGGIIVIDFIDMVLESNRELVLRRLTECLGRDRTKHQVAEVTSLGLVQMTRKRVGQGLLESFSETCETCNGRGVVVHADLLDGTAGRPAARPLPGPPANGRARAVLTPPAAPPVAVPAPPAIPTVAVPEAVPAAASDGAPGGGPDLAEGGPDLVVAVSADGEAELTPVASSHGDAGPPVAAPAADGNAEPNAGSGPRQRRVRRAASRPAGPPAPATV